MRFRVIASVVVFTIAMCNCFWWSSRIPFDGAPDETEHYAMMAWVAAHGTLPHYGDDGFVVSLMDSGTRQRFDIAPQPTDNAALLVSGHHYELRSPYLFSPQLPYLVDGLVCRLFGGISVQRARALNAVHVALAALWTTLAGFSLFRRRPLLAPCAGLCLALWPQVTFLGAYVNDDAFTLDATALLLLAMTRFERRDARIPDAVLLGLTLGLVASAKFYTFAIFPLAAAWGVIQLSRGGRRLLRPLGLAALLGLLVSLPWFVRNMVLYGGDLTGRGALATHAKAAAALLPAALRAQTVMSGAASPAERAMSLAQLIRRDWLPFSLQSYWACFGWMSRWLAHGWYVAALSVVLSLALLPIPRRGDAPHLVPTLFAGPLLFLLLLLSLYYTWFTDFQAQGRYLLISTMAICLRSFDRFEAGGRLLDRVAPPLLLGGFALQNLVAGLRLLD